MKVRYTGASDVRELTKASLKSVGIDHDDVVFSSENDFTATVTEELGNYLIDEEGMFEKAKKK